MVRVIDKRYLVNRLKERLDRLAYSYNQSRNWDEMDNSNTEGFMSAYEEVITDLEQGVYDRPVRVCRKSWNRRR